MAKKGIMEDLKDREDKKKLCGICNKVPWVWKDLENGEPVNVCDECAHRPFKSEKKKQKTSRPRKQTT